MTSFERGLRNETLTDSAHPIRPKEDTMSESELQGQIKSALRRLGYICLDTSTYGSARVMRQARMGGNSKATPDLLVTHDLWPRWMWLGMEVKTETGKLKPEQQELADKDRICVVRSIDDAVYSAGFVTGLFSRLDDQLESKHGN